METVYPDLACFLFVLKIGFLIQNTHSYLDFFFLITVEVKKVAFGALHVPASINK